MFLHFFVRSIIAFLFIGSMSGAVPQHVAHSVIGFYEQRDLELVESLNKTHQGVVACFDTTHFKQGRAALEQLLTHPTTDCTLLRSRQKMIQGLSGERIGVAQTLPFIAQAIGKLAALDVFARDTVAQQFLKNFYYQWSAFKGLNRTSSALDVKHAWSILWGPAAPLLEHGLLHYALEYFKVDPGCECLDNNHGHAGGHEVGSVHAHGDDARGDHGHGAHHGHGHDDGHVRNRLLTAGQWAHFAYHAVSAYEALGLASQRIALINEIYQSLLALKQLLTIAQHLQNDLDMHESMQLMHSTTPNALISSELEHELKELITLLNSSYFAPGASLHWYSLVGQTLKAYRLYEQKKPVIEKLLERLGHLDAFMSVATVVKASAGKPNAWCYATFNEASSASLCALKGVWNCMLGVDRAVANDLVLSEDIGEAHMVLTGPNKAGKSSLLKSVAVAAVLAQSFGIVPAKSATMTPFSAIITFMTVLDDIVTDESSLIARILRADAVVKQLKNLPKDGHALVLLDDSVGQGTSFQKGQEAAYNLFKTVGTSPRTLLIGATHFPRLTQLAPEMPGSFSNWRIRISTQPDGKKESAFVLEPGYSSPDHVYDLVYAQGYLNDN